MVARESRSGGGAGEVRSDESGRGERGKFLSRNKVDRLQKEIESFSFSVSWLQSPGKPQPIYGKAK
jgi:hypothetical protein